MEKVLVIVSGTIIKRKKVRRLEELAKFSMPTEKKIWSKTNFKQIQNSNRFKTNPGQIVGL